jgi:restriction endonuclease S subunit
LDSDFPLVTLGDLCDLYQPKTITQKDLIEDGEFVVFGANGIIGRYDQFNHENPEVIVTCRGNTCGTINMSKPFSWITGNAMVCSPKERSKLSKDFLFYCLKNSDLSSVITGSAQPQITRSSIEKFSIPLPPIEVQQQIVDELEGYQKIIDGCRQVVENYKPTIDIDPSWEMVELGEVCEFAYGKGLKESDRIEGEFDVFGSNGVVGSHSSFLVEHPFIVVGRKGSAGAVHYSTKNGFPIDTTFYISKKELNKSNISLPFLFYTLTSLGLDKTSSQQTVPGLNRNDAYRMKIPLPDLQIQEEIVRKIMDEQSLVSNNKKLIEIYTQKIQDRISNVWGG